GLIASLGYGGSAYLMGWTGGDVMLALLLAPFLREFGKFTVPDFVGDRYYSRAARLIAVLCALFVSFTYIAGQMKGVGVAFSGFLGIPFEWGIVVGMAIVFFYATLGGMKGVTYTQVAQYCVLIFAYTVPAIFMSLIITGNPIPQLGFIGNAAGTDTAMLDKLNTVVTDLGFLEYTQSDKSMFDIFAITGALMFGTAGLPHVIIRFFTVSSAKNARVSAGWALVFIAALYTTAPAVASFARLNFIDTVNESVYAPELAEDGEAVTPEWFASWEATSLLAWVDKNGDGRLQYRAGKPFEEATPVFTGQRGPNGERELALCRADGDTGCVTPTDNDNEVFLNGDIIVLANPEIAGLPGWVIGLVVAGGLAAALSTAAGLLMVISSAVSHDICRRTLYPAMSDRTELRVARGAAAGAVICAGLLGIFAGQLGFVAEVVAFAFGLAAASLFPIIFLGIFWKRMNKEGAIATMVTGLVSTFAYIYYFKFGGGAPEQYWFGVSPEGIGFVFMWASGTIGILTALATAPPPRDIQDLVEDIRVPGTRRAHGLADQDMAPMPAE
ncbi:MAG: sodium:solute symporter family protein, partial [Pseudomonadota bacterium]